MSHTAVFIDYKSILWFWDPGYNFVLFKYVIEEQYSKWPPIFYIYIFLYLDICNFLYLVFFFFFVNFTILDTYRNCHCSSKLKMF